MVSVVLIDDVLFQHDNLNRVHTILRCCEIQELHRKKELTILKSALR